MRSITLNARSKQVLLRLDKTLPIQRKALSNALADIGDMVVTEAERLIMSPPKTGRKYPELPNRSSAPGEAPANQSGKLAGSGGYKVRNHLEMTVGEEVEYAKYLEDGTKKMKKRPHLITAIQNKRQDSVISIYQHLKGVIE